MYPDLQFLYYIYPFKNPEVFNRFVKDLAKAGYNRGTTGYYEINEANRLNGQEIKNLIIGKKAIGYNYYRRSFSEYWSEEGVLEEKTYETPSIGEYWIEGDELCQRFEDRFEGVKHCFDVYYNPKGNAIDKNQYLKLGDVAIIPFSIKE